MVIKVEDGYFYYLTITSSDKTAYFNCTMVLYHIDGTYEHVDGKTYGKIIDHEVGDTSFGYDCIFLSKDLNKTFGSATSEEKNSVSHRFRAASQLKEYLREKDMTTKKILELAVRAYKGFIPSFNRIEIIEDTSNNVIDYIDVEEKTL